MGTKACMICYEMNEPKTGLICEKHHKELLAKAEATARDLDARLWDRCTDLVRVGLDNCHNSARADKAEATIASYSRRLLNDSDGKGTTIVTNAYLNTLIAERDALQVFAQSVRPRPQIVVPAVSEPATSEPTPPEPAPPAPPEPTYEVLHLMTQDNQPYGSSRRCCERCGIMLVGAAADTCAMTTDRATYEKPPTGYVRCDAAPRKESPT